MRKLAWNVDYIRTCEILKHQLLCLFLFSIQIEGKNQMLPHQTLKIALLWHTTPQDLSTACPWVSACVKVLVLNFLLVSDGCHSVWYAEAEFTRNTHTPSVLSSLDEQPQTMACCGYLWLLFLASGVTPPPPPCWGPAWQGHTWGLIYLIELKTFSGHWPN